MRAKPTGCARCPHRHRGNGFAKDHWPLSGSPRVAYLLEAPGYSEVLHSDPDDGFGRPLMGASGDWFNEHCLRMCGLARHEVAIFNTLRCNPSHNIYPTDQLKVLAEKTCRQYDDRLLDYDPTVVGLTYHPAATFRTPSYIAFIEASARKVASLAGEGERPLLIMGKVGFHANGLEWLRGGRDECVPAEGLKKWQGHLWRLKDA